ncbi:YczE/YyaS/YitT family protein [Enterococcus sp. AZ196]|uniref:YczE/YyaS/YitT family protein n=1 Tax=Enterococcus sp. AZ196 TaxID=2774659 RepID=UPI003D2BEF72
MSKNFFLRISWVIVGTILMGIGIEIIVSANRGFDSVSTLILGLMNYSTISFGRWSQLLSLLFLLLTFLYKRRMLGIGSIINTLLVGETINQTASVIQSIAFFQNNSYASFSGFCIMALGTAIYLSGGLGSGPLEGMMFCICELFKISLQKGRVLLDLVIVAFGILLGSTFGVGTLFAIFLLGPMIQGCLSFIKFLKATTCFREKKKQLSE